MVDGSHMKIGGAVLSLPYAGPWVDSPGRGLAVGQRCVVKSSYSAFDPFLNNYGLVSKWPVGRELIYARAYRVGQSEIVELSGRRKSATDGDLRLLLSALEAARNDIASAISQGYPLFDLSVEQEFAFMELPRWLKSSLTAPVAAAALSGISGAPSTIVVLNGNLSLGPEDGGTLDRLQRYLAAQFSAAAKGLILDRAASWIEVYAPWTLVVLLLCTWLFYLQPLTLLATIIAMTVPMGMLAWQSRERGWRLYLLRPGAVTALALYSIGLFGVAYGICALYSMAANSRPERLGNSFLIATSMGLAGGVVGDALSGPALLIAHVQLLLFLGGLATLIARVLRIEALLRDRE